MTIEEVVPTVDPHGVVPDHSRRFAALRKLLRNPMAVLAIVWFAIVLLAAVLAPWITSGPATKVDLAIANLPPFSPGHPLGGDAAGRDILDRLIWGAQTTVVGIAIVTIVSLVVGVTTGLVAGFYRGRFESTSNFVIDIIMSLPGIVLMIALYSLTGPNINLALAVFGFIIAPTYYRLVRSIVVTVRNELYVDAARVVGLSDIRIVGRHVLWAVRAPIIIQTAFTMAAAVGFEAGLTFIGLGDPTSSSWGVMLQQSFTSIYNNPVAVVWPALTISITVLALILFGNALSDVLQSSARSKALSRRKREAAIAASVATLREADTRKVGHTELSSSDDVILAIRDLRIGYPKPDGTVTEVVHGADLDIRRGEIHGLVGESGSGKSQMAFSTLGILPREAIILGGSVYLDGDDLLADPKKQRAARGTRIGYVPQEPMSNLDGTFTIGRQLIKGLRASRPMSKAEAEKKILGLLERVGIRDAKRVMAMYPHEISGGMAQRVLICGAIASDPDIIVADEPTTALDVTIQAEVLEILRGLSEERGLAVLIVTHNLGVVADLCDTVSVMKDGQIVEKADVEDIFEKPEQEYTRRLLSSSRSVELMEDGA
ncbi:peptide/nickel transport system permease protein [Microbacterium terrae]|uniref:Nickel import system ATP-binding protein NikD n=1 Tax=Microbacterium terrae TaxID=69369 RepID=A0A0M2H1W8_9MICO|nr:dipeptide/oligopeptide/nickel ABC transporter permease/ATP-binding protein [Microbacterium terrae]KJL37558.1 putative D,D-dipeptide transport ATP-binding protein DdpD [Microbacterium terrae]MBP1076388.1 peptide/nickel transport system permease protein [Microbacterium terrae]GLJ97213.1 dipeptide/oligopeptide/nickel ABC transporter ATP-binding protein [Microbacterium terrae]